MCAFLGFNPVLSCQLEIIFLPLCVNLFVNISNTFMFQYTCYTVCKKKSLYVEIGCIFILNFYKYALFRHSFIIFKWLWWNYSLTSWVPQPFHIKIFLKQETTLFVFIFIDYYYFNLETRYIVLILSFKYPVCALELQFGKTVID